MSMGCSVNGLKRLATLYDMFGKLIFQDNCIEYFEAVSYFLLSIQSYNVTYRS